MSSNQRQLGKPIPKFPPQERTVPEWNSLASVIKTTLLLPGLAWSMTVRQSQLVTSFLIVSKAHWCSDAQAGRSLEASLVVRVCKTLVCLAKLGRKLAMYLTKPRKAWTSFVFLGTGQDRIWSILEESAWIPHPEIVCPKKNNPVVNNSVFFGLQSPRESQK